MIIIKIWGGLGNQLFQYALYRKFKDMGKEVYADISYVENAERHYSNKYRRLQLDNVKKGLNNLGISVDNMNNRRILHKYKGDRRSISGLWSRYVTHKSLLISEGEYEFPKSFHPEVLEIEEGYLEGYWQTEKYFKDIKNNIYDEIVFSPLKDKKNEDILNIIQNKISVSVHIRRGDYCDPEVFKFFGNICTEEYYLKAIKYFQDVNSDCCFVFFSDDIAWARNTFGSRVQNAYYVDWNQGVRSYYDMYLMSKCNHNIIANSSFSWWGAWLNRHDDKIILCPPKWTNIEERPDILCEEWIRVE